MNLNDDMVAKLMDLGENPDELLRLCPSDDSKQALLEYYELSLWLEREQKRDESMFVNKASRLTDYALQSIDEEIHAESMNTIDAPGGWSELKSEFFTWIIHRFGMLPAKDEVIFPKLQPAMRESERSQFWQYAMPVCLVFIVVYLVFQKPPVNNEPLLSAQVYEQIETDDIQQIIDYNNNGNVRIAMAEQTQIQKISDTNTSLRTGRIWLDVKKGGAGFAVSTDYGYVRVLGTSFGVSRLDNPDRYKIECSEGVVKITVKDFGDVMLTAGNYIILDQYGLQGQKYREQGKKKARWVMLLEAREEIRSIDDDNLVAHWDMDSPIKNDNELIVKDRGPYGYDAFADCEEVDAPRLEFAPSVDSGIFGQALKIEKKDKSWLTIPKPEKISELKDDMTIMAWTRIDGIVENETYRIIGCYDVLYGMHFGFQGTAINLDLGGRNRDAAGYSSDVLQPDQWIHVAATWSKNEKKIRFYANGKLVGEDIIESGRQYAIMDWYIGRNRRFMNEEIRASMPYYFQGCIDEARIYNRVLSEAEIRKISMIDLFKVEGSL